MLFYSSRLSTQEVLDKVSSGAYCLQIIVYPIASASSVPPLLLVFPPFFKKSFGYTELPHVILCIHHLCFSLLLHNAQLF